MEAPIVPPPQPKQLGQALRRNIRALEERRTREASESSTEDRIAQAITGFTGSMRFVCLHLLVYAVWIVMNIGVIPGVKPFDPSFVILASEASVEAIFLSTFVLIAQNRMQASADQRADLDLHINLLAEHELTKLAAVVRAMAEKMGVEIPAEMDEVGSDVAPEAVLDEIGTRKEEQKERR